MVYNPPPGGHVLLILDNGTTAMTGQQEHPGTGRDLMHGAASRIVFEDMLRAIGIEYVVTVDPMDNNLDFERVVQEALDSGRLAVIIWRR